MKDVWKSTTTIRGEPYVMTTSTIRTLQLPARVCLAPGQFWLCCVTAAISAVYRRAS